MSLLTVKGLQISTDSHTLLEPTDISLQEGHKIGLVGRNGCGKSTLLAFLAHPHRTAVQNTSYYNARHGSASGILWEEKEDSSVLLVEQDTLDWSSLLFDAVTEEDIAECTLNEALELALAAHGEEALELYEAWMKFAGLAEGNLGWNIKAYEDTIVPKLSPGTAHRAFLALAFLRPGIKLLLLDEPSNHLDLPSLVWLTQAIRSSRKTFVIVSHDQQLLDAVIDHVWEIDPLTHKLTVITSTYSKYKHSKVLARERQQRLFEGQEKRHKKLTKAAEALKHATKQGERYEAKDHDLLQRDFKRERAGRSGKKAAAIEKFRDSEEKVDRVVDIKPIPFTLDSIDVDSDSSIMFDEVKLAYPGSEALPLPPLSFRINYGERIALIGRNGIGKSSVLKAIMGTLPAASGSVAVGRNLILGNIMQAHESLPRGKTPLEVAASAMKGDEVRLSKKLASFGLTRHQMTHAIKELNPGARVRLLLSLLSIRKVNCLILDEPTNHLDEESIAEVIATVKEYPGTLIVVTHSQYFLESLGISKLLLLSKEGLKEIPSLDGFVKSLEEEAKLVVEKMAVL